MSFPQYEQYRDSGVEWLGNVPEHWTVCALNYRYEVALGKMLDEKKITGNHLAPYLRNVDVQWGKINTTDLPEMDFSGDDIERYSLRSGDLVVCEGGEVGRAAVWNAELVECFYQKAIHRLRPRTESDAAHFFFHVLRCAVALGAFSSNDAKTTISHLPAETFRHHFFSFPPICEQRSISAFLDYETAKIDALIEEQRRLIELLKEKRQAVISHAVTKGINAHAPMRDSDIDCLGQIPEHWLITPLRFLVKFISGGTPDKKEPLYWQGPIPWVSAKDMKVRRIGDAEDHISETAVTESGLKLIPAGHLLMVVRGMILAHSLPVALTSGTVTINQDLKAIKCDDNMSVVFLQFVFEALKSHIIANAGESAHGTKKLESEMLGRLDIPVPLLEEQQEIVDALERKVEALDSVGHSASRNIELLQERRTALISSAVTGKIDVRNFTPKGAA